MITGQGAGIVLVCWALFNGAWLTFGAAQSLEGQH